MNGAHQHMEHGHSCNPDANSLSRGSLAHNPTCKAKGGLVQSGGAILLDSVLLAPKCSIWAQVLRCWRLRVQPPTSSPSPSRRTLPPTGAELQRTLARPCRPLSSPPPSTTAVNSSAPASAQSSSPTARPVVPPVRAFPLRRAMNSRLLANPKP